MIDSGPSTRAPAARLCQRRTLWDASGRGPARRQTRQGRSVRHDDETVVTYSRRHDDRLRRPWTAGVSRKGLTARVGGCGARSAPQPLVNHRRRTVRQVAPLSSRPPALSSLRRKDPSSTRATAASSQLEMPLAPRPKAHRRIRHTFALSVWPFFHRSQPADSGARLCRRADPGGNHGEAGLDDGRRVRRSPDDPRAGRPPGSPGLCLTCARSFAAASGRCLSRKSRRLRVDAPAVASLRWAPALAALGWAREGDTVGGCGGVGAVPHIDNAKVCRSQRGALRAGRGARFARHGGVAVDGPESHWEGGAADRGFSVISRPAVARC